ncbi:MAG: hypothetical protein WBL68_08695, partial [Nitrososphaeraceae archaeon]
MAKMQKNNLNTSPDETRTFEKGKIELANFGDITIGRGILEPGYRFLFRLHFCLILLEDYYCRLTRM